MPEKLAFLARECLYIWALSQRISVWPEDELVKLCLLSLQDGV